MFTVNTVSKYYGSIPALSEVTFSLEQGDVLGLLGLNGAGKSTLLKGLAGVFPFSSGEVTCFQHTLTRDPSRYRSMLGYQPERSCFPKLMTVSEMSQFVAELQGVPRSELSTRLGELYEVLSLDSLLHVPCGELSKGEQQRLGFLAAVVHRPKLLILDEPMSGLDPKQMIEFRSFIRDGASERITILSTHLLSEIHAVCNKLLILHEGKVVEFKEDLSNESLDRLEKYFVHAVPHSGAQAETKVVHSI